MEQWSQDYQFHHYQNQNWTHLKSQKILKILIIEKLYSRSGSLTAEDSPEVSVDEMEYNILFPSLDEGEIAYNEIHQWKNNDLDDLISQDDQMDKIMIGMKVQLPVNGNQYFEGTVVNRKRNSA